MTPINFTDEEMELLLSLCQPIEQHLRPQFLSAVATELEASGQADGPGLVHRVARQVQRQFWEPPQLREGQAARRA